MWSGRNRPQLVPADDRSENRCRLRHHLCGTFLQYNSSAGFPVTAAPIGATTMSQVENAVTSSVVAVYPDHLAAERTVRHLHESGIAMRDLSIVGRGSQTTEEPIGFVGDSEYASAGAATGAWLGGLLGLCVGAAFLVLPGIGPIVVAGPLSAALMAGIEGAIAGTALGGVAGALVGWGVPKEKALKYETHVKGGKFLVIIRGEPEVIARARTLIAHDAPEHFEHYEPAAP
jgi:hypothetical protein